MTERSSRDHLRIVIKVGSGLLVSADGKLRLDWLEALASDLATLQGKSEVLIVSSGAIGLGRGPLGIDQGSKRLDELQAAAALGQIRLANGWNSTLADAGLVTAQLLLTLEDTENRRRYLNALETIRVLLDRKVIPVINENDTVATDEIRYGDNDRLAARVAQMVDADALLLFTDVNGLFDGPPDEPASKLVERVDTISPAIESMALPQRSKLGTGGMQSKLAAAKIAVAAGCQVYLANGQEPGALGRFLAGASCTHFVASGKHGAARKRWIGASLKTTGSVWLDEGAVEALRSGKSLLSVGVEKVAGEFSRGDALLLFDANDNEIGRGLSSLDRHEADERLIAKKQAIADHQRSVFVHRNDMVLVS